PGTGRGTGDRGARYRVRRALRRGGVRGRWRRAGYRPHRGCLRRGRADAARRRGQRRLDRAADLATRAGTEGVVGVGAAGPPAVRGDDLPGGGPGTAGALVRADRAAPAADRGGTPGPAP